MLAAKTAAGRQSVFGWAVFGFFIPLVALLVVYLRSPQVPPMLLVQRGDDDSDTLRVFEAQFIETLKARQVAHTWIGAAIGAGLGLIAFMILMSVWAGVMAEIAVM